MTTEYKVLPGQITMIHVLLGKINKQVGLTADEAKLYKQARVREYTHSRESSTTKLTWKEAQDLITGLAQAAGHTVTVHLKKPDAQAVARQKEKGLADRKRKRIIHMAHSMGHQIKSEEPRAGAKADMQWVNAWCVEYGYLKKELNSYTNEELSKLLWQMEQVYTHYLQEVSRDLNKV